MWGGTRPGRAALIAGVVVMLAAAPTMAQDTGRTHVVRRGDTLWDLARQYLGNPFLWPRIFDANRGVVKDPNLIFPTEQLLIPPMLADTTKAVVLPPAPAPAVPRPAAAVVESVRVADRDRPPLDSIVPEPPAVAASPLAFYAVSWLADTTALPVVGHLLRLAEPGLMSDRLPARLHPFERFVVVSGDTAVRSGDTVLVAQYGRAVRGYGRVVEPAGLLRVDSVGSGLFTATVVRQFGMAQLGDPVLKPPPVQEAAPGTPAVVADGVGGRLITFREDHAIHDVNEEAYVNLGTGDGLVPGDELEVLAPMPENAGGRHLPPEPLGTVRVMRVEEHAATVRVIGLRSAGLRDGLLVRVVKKVR